MSLGTGIVGRALVFDALVRGGRGELAARADEALAAAIDWAPVNGPGANVGLISGLFGLAYLLEVVRARDQLRDARSALQRGAQEYVRLWAERPPHRLRSQDYDLVGGLVGVASYLLLTDAKSEVRLACDCLCSLVEHEDGRAFFLAPDRLWNAQARTAYPDGCLNLGLAHGIAGVLAFLSIAYIRAPYREAHVARAIEALARALLCFSVEDRYGRHWPACIEPPTGDANGVGLTTPFRARLPFRSGWCYGAPGIALALCHAAAALQSGSLKQTALEVVEGALTRTREGAVPEMDDHLCHGVAGLVLIGSAFDLSDRARLDFQRLQTRLCSAHHSLDGTLLEGPLGIALTCAVVGDSSLASHTRWLAM